MSADAPSPPAWPSMDGLPQGTTIEWTRTETTEAASSLGAGLATESAEAAGKFRTSAGGVDTSASSVGDAVGWARFEISADSPGVSLLLILGAICVVGGGLVAFWLKRLTLGATLAGVGALLIAGSLYPWLWLVGGAGFVGWLGWMLFEQRRVDRAAGVIANGIERSPDASRTAVKSSIFSHGGDRMRKTIRAIKSRAGVT